jgi:hypothetical protein
MPEVLVFGEDDGHALVLGSLVQRLAEERGVPVRVAVRFARGGYGPMLRELSRFVRDLRAGQQPLPDLLVVGRDGNCQGHAKAKEAVAGALGSYGVVGKGCPAPDHKCKKDRYKEQLVRAIRDAGLQPVLGGLEYAEELVQALDLNGVARADPSFGHLLDDLRQHVNQWKPA